MPRRLILREERFAYREPFRIAGHLFTETQVLVAEISEGTATGSGEGAGVYYMGDDIAHMRRSAESVRAAIEAGADRVELQSLLPPGGARNALDCALWDLEAQTRGIPAWRLAGLDAFAALPTTMTIGADTPEAMAAVASGRFGDWPKLKLKLTGEAELDEERVAAVRSARPDAWIGVDANQGYRVETLAWLFTMLGRHDIRLLEQPLPRGEHAALRTIERVVPCAADESVRTLEELEQWGDCFDSINIKLDKCGGLTEGLAIARRCKELGLGVMVGNMMGTSLSMAPSMVIGQLCEIVDLDGPTFLKADREPAVCYRDGRIGIGDVAWGRMRGITAPAVPSSD